MPLAAVAVVAAACAGGSQPVARVDWATTPPASGHVVDGIVKVIAPAGGGTFPLAVVERPRVPAQGYALSGQIRFDGVQGRGFVEMWSDFASGERYFSRTLAQEGPQSALSGTSDWRAMELPFFLEGGAPPERLEIGLVLPGAGTVEIGPLEVVPMGASSGAWWSDRTAGFIGGIVGSAIGVFGAAIGWLVARRRARGFVLAAMKGAVVVGAACIGVGVVALVGSQPYGVAYPWFLTGAILVAVFGGLLSGARRAYADQELRRMRALDRA